ncbi:efflux RND transporter periplasmic adaptor subunit [Acidovorax sp. PRC11]|uniref:efflux RND transporter periplasmic adaptor subunit n=1 Tax=Acidovorax sp. PRC11 TaxID=2962592 RepID=UPI0028821D55|nr:efflux RND transporter periplasmic adaptor subunit [Acidovorax sp. PRC11]MDT0139924.1 efflux RND transporter periplasmic adaptor subunit [Acidovorax sp. PRC11]
MKAARKWAVGLGTVALVAAAAISLTIMRTGARTDLATAVVARGTLAQEVLAVGKVRPKELVAVGAQVSGRVERLHVHLGQRVGKGALIAEVDAQPQQLALRSAQAAVDALRAQRVARDVALAHARLSLRRQQTLAQTEATAQADVEAAQAAADTLQADIDALRAQIAQARTQVETARTQLSYTRIVAPMDGVVVSVITKQGQTLNAFQSTPAIVMLAKLDVVTVRAEISEADVNTVAPGMAASFVVPGSQTESYQVRIAQIEPAPDSIASEAMPAGNASLAGNATKAVYYNALFDVPNDRGLLRPAMTVQVSVHIRQVEDALLVPVAALHPAPKAGHGTVRVLQPNGDVVSREVLTGLRTPLKVQILRGLEPGERVVIGEAAADAPTPQGPAPW